MPAVEAAKRADRPLVVLAEEVDGPALQLLVGGNMHKTMQSVVVRAPGFGHRRVAELQDLAIALGGQVIAKDTGLELAEVTGELLGSCDRITVTENSTTIVGGHGEQHNLETRVAQLELTGDEAVGRDVIHNALTEPLRWIAINAGYDGDEVVANVAQLPVGEGFDALTGQYGSMADAGVIDPLTVTATALESAASIAALVITTETTIVEEVVGNPGAIIAPGFGDLAEGMVRPSNIY